MILREMPDIWDTAYREWFYSRWGKESAEQLLLNDSMPVEQVASLAGFQSRTTLFRHMQRKTGRCPNALRREATQSAHS